MSYEAIVVISVVILALVLFITEALPIDLVSIIIMITLVISGVITPEEGVQGFSNPATIVVAAMFIFSTALLKTGAVNRLVPRMALLFRFNQRLGMFVMMFLVGIMSAFINNTTIVAIFIPFVIKASVRARINASKFLIPLSFASLFGGICTLIGTSTNVLVSGMAVQSGLESIKMFQMTPMGIVFFAVGMIYMLTIGIKLLPQKAYQADLTDRFNMRMYLAEITILPGSPFIEKSIKESALIEQLDISIISLERNNHWNFMPSEDLQLKAGDVLKIRCDAEKIKELKKEIGVMLTGDFELGEKDIAVDDAVLAEIAIGSSRTLNGKTVQQIGFKNQFGALVLAIKHQGEIVHEKIKKTPLRAGDILLVETTKERLMDYQKLEAAGQLPFSLISEIDLPSFKRKKMYVVLSVLAMVVLLASTEVLPLMVAAISGTVILFLTRCLAVSEAYEAIEWKVIFLLAGAISLGLAMQKSGVAQMLSQLIIDTFGDLGPVAIISALYLTASILTEFMSNNASSALLVPVVLSIAASLELSPLPFLMTIAFAGSASFMTPVGYQTNTMVYSAGQYRFMDFVKVGTPLNFIFWIIATLLIPVFYPF